MIDRPETLGRFWRVGWAADPGIDMLLDKGRIAQIKIRQLDLIIHELESQLELAKLQQKMLKDEYKIG